MPLKIETQRTSSFHIFKISPHLSNCFLPFLLCKILLVMMPVIFSRPIHTTSKYIIYSYLYIHLWHSELQSNYCSGSINRSAFY